MNSVRTIEMNKTNYFPQIPAQGLVLVCVIALNSCSTTHYKESADKEVYAIVDQKRGAVPGMPEFFDIESKGAPDLEGLPVNEASPEYLGEEGQAEAGAKILSLEKALEIAFNHSREYQTRKENLYIEALNLTLDRHRFDPIFAGNLSGEVDHFTTDVVTTNTLGTFLAETPGIAQNLETLTGSAGDLLRQYSNLVGAAATVTGANTTSTDVVDERTISGNTSFGLDVLLKHGGRFALDLTSNFLQFLTGDSREAASSLLTGSFTQPLLRGGGRRVTLENLTQAERDVLYELRTFTRFRKQFSVQVASSYYRVLRTRDAVNNNYRGLRSFELSLEREQAFAEVGQSTPAAVGRVQQALLSSQLRWIDSVRNYRAQLDQFKIILGIPADAPVILDDRELEYLADRGIIHPNLGADEAVQIALATRLDLQNQRGFIDDSQRRIYVAANTLLPDLDIVLSGRVDSQDDNQPFDPDFDRTTLNAGLLLDLPLDRKAERNAYRAALIDFDRNTRNYTLAEDEIKRDVRDVWRSLDQQRRNYEIALQELDLSLRRVEEQELRAELGLGNALDLVDARNDLTGAENNLTAALIEHTIGRLEFWRDLGILFIKENGQWEEIDDVDEP